MSAKLVRNVDPSTYIGSGYGFQGVCSYGGHASARNVLIVSGRSSSGRLRTSCWALCDEHADAWEAEHHDP